MYLSATSLRLNVSMKFLITVFLITVYSSGLVYCGHGIFSLNQSNLIIASYKNPLANIPNFAVNQPSLLEVECLNLLADKLHFTFDIKVPPIIGGESNIPSFGFQMADGTWTGAMGLLQRKEVDMCISFSPPSANKKEITDNSFPVLFDETSILIPYPQETGKITALAEPFSPMVWIWILISAVVAPVSLWLVDRLQKPNKDKRESFRNYAFLFIEMMISRRAVHKRTSLSYRFICGSALLASIVLVNIYSGIYTSILAVPRFQVTITSIEDVAANPNIKLHVFKDTPTDNYVRTSVDNTMSLIRDQLNRNPSQRLSFKNYTSTGDISSTIKDDRVLLNPSIINRRLIKESYIKNNNTCKVTMAEKVVFSRMESIDYPKDSPLTKPIDRELLLLHQFGLLDYANRKTFRQLNGGGNDKNPCLLTKGRNLADTNKTKLSMDLRSFSGAFLGLGIGSALALLALIAERVIRARMKAIEARHISSINLDGFF